VIPLQVLREELQLGEVRTHDHMLTRYEAAAVDILERETGDYFGPSVEHVEPFTGRALTRTPTGPVVLEYGGPDTWSEVGADEYQVTGRVVQMVYPYRFVYRGALRARYTAGYDTDAAPAWAKHAIVETVRHWYQSHTRGAPAGIAIPQPDLPPMVRRIIQTYRRML
jgi:hypothetical protein